MSATSNRLLSCLKLAQAATFRGEAEAALEAAKRLCVKDGFANVELAAKYWHIDLDMGRFDRPANEPRKPFTSQDSRSDWNIELTASQRRILRTVWSRHSYVRTHQKGTRWDVSGMPDEIKRSLGL